MRKFFNFWLLITRKEKISFFFIVFFYVFQALLEMIGIAAVLPFVTFLLKPEALSDVPIISEFINFKDIQFEGNIIIILCIIFFIVFLLKNLFILFTNKLTFNYVFLVRKRLFQDLLNKIIHQNYIFFIDNGFSKISNILNTEVNNFSVNIIRPIINLTSEILILLAIFFLIYITGYLNGLIFILPFILLIGVILKIINRSIKKWSNQRIISNEKLISLKLNLIHGIKEVLIYGKVNKIFEQISSVLKNLKDVDTKNNFVIHLPKIFLEQSLILIFIFIILILDYSGQSYENIIITLSFYLVVSYRLVPSFNKIFAAYQSLKYGQPSIPKILEFHGLKEKNLFFKNNIYLPFNKTIELKNIDFNYTDEKNLIKNLNLKINKYDFIGIYGESGSGKTTLINILINLLKIDKGKILVDENEINNLEISRKYINLFSIASQDTFLIEGTVKDNIIFGSGSNFSEKKMKEAIKFARLEKFIETLDRGVDTFIPPG